MDGVSGPLTAMELVLGCSRAAFSGLMVLKRTEDRQPVKPKEPSRASSGSNAESVGDRKFKRTLDISLIGIFRV